MLVLCLPAIANEDSSALTTLSDCVRLVHGHSYTGLDQIRTHCPELEQSLFALNVADKLGADWQSRLTPHALEGILSLVERFQGQPAGAVPDVANVGAAIQSLHVRHVQDSWWQRFKAWLASWLRSPEVRQGDSSWLRQLLARIDLPPAVARIVGYGSVALLLAMALYVVWRELRLSGVLSRARRRPTGQSPGTPRFATNEPLLDPEQLRGLPPWQQPAAVLGLLVQALRGSGRLDIERSLTHRELVERARLDALSQRDCFRRVAQLAERQLYGLHGSDGLAANDVELRAAIAEGLTLHAQLAGARGGA